MFALLRTYLRYTSWPIVAAMVALLGVGMSAISVSQQAAGGQGQSVNSQATFAAVGLAAFVAAVIVPYPRLGRLAYVLFGATIILLVGVLFTSPMKGATRWFNLGLVKLQPSEIAKLTYVLLLAWYLRYGDHYRRLGGLIPPFVLAFIPMGLILIEPDLGTSLLFLPTLYFMLFMAGAKLRHLLAILAMGMAVILLPAPCRVSDQTFAEQAPSLLASRLGPATFYRPDRSKDEGGRPDLPVAYCRVRLGDGGVYDVQPLSVRMMRGHQMDRIKGWLRQDDSEVAMSEGFQLRWSLVTLAAGHVAGPPRPNAGDARTGTPLAGGSQVDMFRLALQQLPHDRTDFIFSVIGGKWGLLGCLAVLGIYGVVFVFGVEIATVTDDPFGRLLAVGVVGILLSQVFINVGMTMGLMPITGMTLPLVSYGGSSLVVSCAAMGLLVNVGQRRAVFLSRRPFEYGRRKDKRAGIESAMGRAVNARPRRPGGGAGG